MTGAAGGGGAENITDEVITLAFRSLRQITRTYSKFNRRFNRALGGSLGEVRLGSLTSSLLSLAAPPTESVLRPESAPETPLEYAETCLGRG